MHYRLDGELRKVDKDGPDFRMGDWIIEKNDPETNIDSTWEVRTDQSYAERVDKSPLGPKRVISDFTAGTPRHSLMLGKKSLGLTLVHFEDRTEFNIFGFISDSSTENIWIFATYSQGGWLKTIGLHIFPLPQKGKGVEVDSEKDQRRFYEKRTVEENIKHLAQMMRLRNSRHAKDISVLETKSLSEFKLGFHKMSFSVNRYLMLKNEQNSLQEMIARARMSVSDRVKGILSGGYSDEEIEVVSSWLETYVTACIQYLDKVGRGLEDLEDLTDVMLRDGAISFIIDHNNETLYSSALDLEIEFRPDAYPEELEYRVLGDSAKLVRSEKRELGEKFVYGENLFLISGDVIPEQLSFTIRHLLNKRDPKMMVFPSYIPPETMTLFEDFVGTKSNTGWEKGFELIKAKCLWDE